MDYMKTLLATPVLLLRACIAGVAYKWVYSILGRELVGGCLPSRSLVMGLRITIVCMFPKLTYFVSGSKSAEPYFLVRSGR
jgi:hypothetical protein